MWPAILHAAMLHAHQQFMDAYRWGLTGKAAEWAVKREKLYRRVGQQAMISIEAVLNTN